MPGRRNKINRMVAESEFWKILRGRALDKLDFADHDHSRRPAAGGGGSRDNGKNPVNGYPESKGNDHGFRNGAKWGVSIAVGRFLAGVFVCRGRGVRGSQR